MAWKPSDLEALIERHHCQLATDEEIRNLMDFLRAHPEATRIDLEGIPGIRPEALEEILRALEEPRNPIETETVWELTDHTEEVLEEVAHQAPEVEPLVSGNPEEQPSGPSDTLLEILPPKRRWLRLSVLLAFVVSIPAGFWVARHVRRSHLATLPPPAAHVALSRAEMNARFLKAIQETQGEKVVYDDVLGEGDGAWDSNPRYPDSRVNCIIWIDQVISEVYASRPEERIPILDRIRYYGGHVGYGLRKHYIVRWISLEPEPLIKLPALKYTRAVAHERVKLEFKRFLKFHDFPCGLYRIARDRFDYEYVKPKGLVEMAGKLPEGFYILFAVATPKYIKAYGKISGPLGLVHGLLLQVKGKSGRRKPKDLFVYHASTAAKRIRKEKLAVYVARMSKSLHKGYVVYELDPGWDFTKPLSEDPEAFSIQKCESGIRSHRSSSRLE